MIARALLFSKHRLPVLWGLVGWLDARLYRLLHGNQFSEQADICLAEFTLDAYEFRWIRQEDLQALEKLVARQCSERLHGSQPHGFYCDRPTSIVLGERDCGESSSGASKL